jgi:hypothetical protein
VLFTWLPDPSGCLERDGPFRSGHASGCCSLTIHRDRIEFVDGKSDGGKGLPDTVPSTKFMIASTDIFIFEVAIRRI